MSGQRKSKDRKTTQSPRCPWLLLLSSHSVMSDSLQPHGLQHTRQPRPSLSSGACSNSCPLSQWCHPTILSSVVLFSSSFQSFPASGSFLMSWLFTSGGQNIGVSASASVLPMNIEGWFPLGWTGWISLPRDSQESSPTPQFKSISFLALSLLYGPTLTSIHAAAATAAKSLQSCPTLCDPIDGSPSVSPIPGIFQARTLEWVAISFSKSSSNLW